MPTALEVLHRLRVESYSRRKAYQEAGGAETYYLDGKVQALDEALAALEEGAPTPRAAERYGLVPTAAPDRYAFAADETSVLIAATANVAVRVRLEPTVVVGRPNVCVEAWRTDRDDDEHDEIVVPTTDR